ncbi:hypothetical protein BT69DRAFT_1277283, partial [Atractiella rhizophila]
MTPSPSPSPPSIASTSASSLSASPSASWNSLKSNNYTPPLSNDDEQEFSPPSDQSGSGNVEGVGGIGGGRGSWIEGAKGLERGGTVKGHGNNGIFSSISFSKGSSY